MKATEAHIQTIEAQAYNDVAREFKREGLELTLEQADRIGDLGMGWLRTRLGMKCEETADGVSCRSRTDN